jgi:hypothetical protein
MGKMVASHEKNMHREATNANWIKVSVAGLGKALRMAFEEVFVRALDRYHIMQRIYSINQYGILYWKEVSRTINLGETGAFNAPATSCTLALTLALLVRIVLKASLKLFCLLCSPVFPFAHAGPFNALFLLGCHRGSETGPPMNPLLEEMGLE